MNKIFKVNRKCVRGIFKKQKGYLPPAEYWVSCPQKTEGLWLFTNVATNAHWLVFHNEMRLWENRGVITHTFCS